MRVHYRRRLFLYQDQGCPFADPPTSPVFLQNPDVPDTPEDWLDQFNTFSIYEILPQIIELWGLNVEQQVESKKNIIRQSGK
ncbi:MAG: hypothetical protein U0N00_08190 [Oscillospiraceae bacterium]